MELAGKGEFKERRVMDGLVWRRWETGWVTRADEGPQVLSWDNIEEIIWRIRRGK